MSWRIVMIEHGEYLRLKLDNLFVERKQEDYTIPLSDVSIIVVSNLECGITTRLLDALTSHNIGLIVCDYKQQPSGIFTGLNTHSRVSKMMREQILWSDDFKYNCWTKIIKSKINNQRKVLLDLTNNTKRAVQLEIFEKQVEYNDVTNREGHAAKVYFNTIFGSSFTRDDEENIYNACLNYGYAIVRAYFTRLIVAYGFTGLIGVHHKSEYNNFNLVDDLMEPFRPFLDAYVHRLVTVDTIFDFETRYKIIDFLHQKYAYNNSKQQMLNIIEKYIQSFIRYCKEQKDDELKFPYYAKNE